VRLADALWLTDENIHPDVVAHLRARGLDVSDVREQGWYGRSDEELLREAHRAGRIVLTHDGDFGTLALLGRRPVGKLRRVFFHALGSSPYVHGVNAVNGPRRTPISKLYRKRRSPMATVL
jgi:hypothetical protein